MFFMGWGMLTIWRLDQGYGIRQTGWFIVALSSLYLLLTFGRDLRWLRRYRYVWITIGLGLMALTLIFGTHPGGGAPRLWLGCCGFYFQPSEGLRILLVIFLAAYLADRLPFKRSNGIPWSVQTWLPLILIWLLSLSLLIAQRDLGTGMLFLALLTMLLYLVIQRWEVLLIAGVLGLIAALAGYWLFDVVALRVKAWLNPWDDPLGGSYQIVQSLITVAAGGLFGKGLGMGSPGFVPAIHTDFIFSAIIEEHGLLGGLGLIGLWGIWLSRILQSVRRHMDAFSALLTAGLGISIGLQALLIIGGNLRLFPLVGITLPFLSYGGSSLLISCVSLGILLLLTPTSRFDIRFRKPVRYLHTGMLIGWGIVAVLIGWWSLVRAPALIARGDNPRWAIDSRYSKRGEIFDREGVRLAETIGSSGEYQRAYPIPQAVAVVGYDAFPYGQSGLEQSLDDILRGTGLEDRGAVIWSALTRAVSPVGADVRITLDAELQAQALDLLTGKQGAVVLIEAESGEILIAASAPSFDPNDLENEWTRLLNDPASPLLNRAFQGRYQPGMVLAPFFVGWALDQGSIELNTRVPDLGMPVSIDGSELTCVIQPDRADEASLQRALELGCPTPILQLGEQLGESAYRRMLAVYGFDQMPADDFQSMPVQVEIGPAPDQVGYAAIGQASLTLSPLQVARALAVVLAEGRLPQLRLLDAIRTDSGEWQALETAGETQQALSTVIVESLRVAISDEEYFGYSAQAIAGEPIGWFLGGTRSLVGTYGVVVVLENEPLTEAVRIGGSLLLLAEENAIP
jgi:cell division protein FtsW (lipid II flippase)